MTEKTDEHAPARKIGKVDRGAFSSLTPAFGRAYPALHRACKPTRQTAITHNYDRPLAKARLR
jgi:hypothetical protein